MPNKAIVFLLTMNTKLYKILHIQIYYFFDSLMLLLRALLATKQSKGRVKEHNDQIRKLFYHQKKLIKIYTHDGA